MSACEDLSSPLAFDDITPVEVPVKLGARRFVLCEASGDAVCRWRNAQFRGAKMEGNKMTELGPVADGEPLLVSLCLFELVGPDGSQRKPVPANVVRSWPARVQKALFDRVRKISGLEDEAPAGEADGQAQPPAAAEERAKN